MIIHNDNPGTKFHVMYDPNTQKIAMYMWMVDAVGRRYAPKPVTDMEEYEVDGYYRPPFLQLDPESAQYLANALWEAGITPVGAAGSSGQMGAVKEHLEDAKVVRDKMIELVSHDYRESS